MYVGRSPADGKLFRQSSCFPGPGSLDNMTASKCKSCENHKTWSSVTMNYSSDQCCITFSSVSNKRVRAAH